MATIFEHMENAEKRARDALEVVREALKKNNLDEYASQKKELEKAVEDLNANIVKVHYSNLAKADKPIIAAVEQFNIPREIVKETIDKETGKITDIKIEATVRRIDLKKFCESENLPTEWVKSTNELRDLLEARETKLYSLRPSELAKKSYYFNVIMRDKEDGKTPDSNTQIVRKLQQAIDEAIFVDNGEGKNVYKCTSHDLAFIQDAVTKFNPKKKCSIAMLNQRAFQTVMMSVFAHCLGEEIVIVSGAKKTKQN